VRVALFVPCYVDQLAPRVGLAALRVLERLGCDVDYDPRQTCCGQPLLTAGAAQGAARLARQFVGRFASADAFVSPSASCVATVRRRYAELGVEDSGGACARTFELCEFVVRRLGASDVGARFPHRVAALESCHGLRELALGTASEAAGPERAGPLETLLASVRDLELVRPARRDECCGFGGVFSVDFPELSGRMGRDRLQEMAAARAEYVTGSDASCLLHFEGIARRSGAGPRAIHVAEILAGPGKP
jgi:L-lactate dehydrogenase complex protein LldE